MTVSNEISLNTYYLRKTEIDELLSNKLADVAFSGSYNDLIDKPDNNQSEEINNLTNELNALSSRVPNIEEEFNEYYDDMAN